MRKNIPSNRSFVIPLDFESSTHLFSQIVQFICRRVECGDLKPGEKLPSTRQLARMLKVSRATTSAAYCELHRLGMIDNATHAGTFVTRRVFAGRLKSAQTVAKEATTAPGERLMNFAPDDPLTGAAVRIKSAEFPETPLIPSCLLPQKKWNFLLKKRQMREPPFSNQIEPTANLLWSCGEQESEFRLADALSAYLARSRAVETTPDQILVFGNERQALHAIVSVLTSQGDTVAHEDPCSPSVRALFLARNAKLFEIPVDLNGMLVHQLEDAGSVKLIYTTPTNQTPLGLTMQAERRQSLLDFAGRRNAMIIENDSNHELAYGNTFIPAMKSLDRDSRVIYLSSFGRFLSPLTELAFVVAPPSIAHKLAGARTLFGTSASSIEIDVTAAMLELGHLERHFQSLRACFALKRRQLIECLLDAFGRSVYLYPSAMGNTICARFNNVYPQDRLVETAIRTGLPAFDASPFFKTEAGHRLLFSLPHLDENTIQQKVSTFKAELDKAMFTPCAGLSPLEVADIILE